MSEPTTKGIGYQVAALIVFALLILGCGWGLVWGWVETVRLTK
jgi:hypothetical protein